MYLQIYLPTYLPTYVSTCLSLTLCTAEVERGKACVLSHSVVLTLCNIMDCSLPGSSSMEFSRQENGWVFMPFSMGSSQSRDRTQVSCIEGRFFTIEPPWNNLVIHCFSHHPLRALNDLFPSMQASSNSLRFLETISFNLAKEQVLGRAYWIYTIPLPMA